jgi:hypothetical protein
MAIHRLKNQIRPRFGKKGEFNRKVQNGGNALCPYNTDFLDTPSIGYA